MAKQEKEKIIEELKKKFEKSKIFFLTDFTGLRVREITQLRKSFREKGVEYKVVKNTLIRLAADNRAYSPITNYLEGPTGVVFGYDEPTLPAKILYDFQRKTEKPKTKVFWMEGKIYEGGKLKELATVPSKEELLAALMGFLNSPLANFVGTLSGVLRNFIGTLEAVTKSKSDKVG
jgi:large subunit ribosomal protein L10